jgi:hypothetical protein
MKKVEAIIRTSEPEKGRNQINQTEIQCSLSKDTGVSVVNNDLKII